MALYEFRFQIDEWHFFLKAKYSLGAREFYQTNVGTASAISKFYRFGILAEIQFFKNQGVINFFSPFFETLGHY